MDEQRVREIVREELAEQLKKAHPVHVNLTPDIQVTSVDAVLDRLTQRIESELACANEKGLYT